MRKLLNEAKFSGLEILDLLIEFVYLAIIFWVPLVFSYWLKAYNAFELPKLVLFKILVWSLLLLTLIKLIFYFSKSNWSSSLKIIFSWFKKYWLIPIIFLAGLSVTLFFAIDFSQSFFGSYDRGQGLVTYFFYGLWLILFSFNILTISNRSSSGEDSLAKRVRRVIKTAVCSGLLVSLYGILQFLKIDFLTWAEPAFLTHRTFSTFGQPNFLASWLLLVIPLNFYLIFTTRPTWGRIFYSFSGLSGLLCLFLTASRGALFALVLSGLLALVYWLWFAISSRFKKIVISVLFFIILLGGLLSLEIFLPGRLTRIFDYQSGSLAARLNFYTAASDAILKKPIWGYGLENSGEVFIKYYEPNWALFGQVNASTDRAHNLIFDILLSTGAWGLFFFILFYFYFYKLAVTLWQKNKNRTLSLTLAFSVTAYLFSLLFSFSIISGEIYLWLFLALLVVLSVSQSENFSESFFANSTNTKRFLRVSLACLVFALIFWQIQANFKILIADQYFNKLYYSLAQKDYPTTFLLADYIDETQINSVNHGFYNRFLGDKLSDFYPTIDELALKARASERLKKIFDNLSENGYENLLVKGKISFLLGQPSVSEEYFSQLTSITPYWPRVYFEEAKLAKASGDLISAQRIFAQAIINLPSLNDPRLGNEQRTALQYYLYVINREIGNTYFLDKNYGAAEKYYQLAYRYNPSDFTLFKNIADTYYFRYDLATAKKYNQRGYQRNPQDYNWLLALASLEQEDGNKTQALIYLAQALKIAPDNNWLKKLREEYNQ